MALLILPLAMTPSLFFRSPNHWQPRISAEDEMSIADKSLQKTAKTASAPSHSHDSSGNDAPSLISNPLHRRKPVPTAKVDPGLRRESAEGTSSCIN